MNSTVRGNSISRTQLTIILVTVSLAGAGYAFFLSVMTPNAPELKLSAQVAVAVQQWRPENGDASETRLLPCIKVTNPSNEPWRNVSVSINEMFFHYRNEVILPGDSFTTPCENFLTKGGNVAFRPASQNIDQITVFAQVPSGERGVFEQQIGDE